MKLAKDEFQRLAMEQLDMLYRLALRLTKEGNRAEDLVQETYLRAFRGADGFDFKQYGIRPWLARIMHNLHISRSTREDRQPRAMDGERLEAAAGSSPGEGFPPINLSSFDAMDENLVAALEGLPPEYQSVLLLWAVEEFTYKEIAEALEVPIGTVMSRLYRARQKLSEQLRPSPAAAAKDRNALE